MNYVTRLSSKNIFHILYKEILVLSHFSLDDLRNGTLYVVEGKHKNSLAQAWRIFLLSNIFARVEFILEKRISNLSYTVDIKTKPSFDCHTFLDYDPNTEYIALANLIKDTVCNSRTDQDYVLLNQREPDNRYLIDSNTSLPLHQFLSRELKSRNIPFRLCDFSAITPREQAEISNGAFILISAHGAGLSNMIFTSDNCKILEYNFRNHWYCDPVCDQHYFAKLPFHEKCEGELTFKPFFHKADYHNLSKLLNKSYEELDISLCEGFTARNPISRCKLYVDGSKLVSMIEKEYLNLRKS